MPDSIDRGEENMKTNGERSQRVDTPLNVGRSNRELESRQPMRRRQPRQADASAESHGAHPT